MAKPVRPLDLALLLFLGGAWGSSFMFIKIGIETIPPIALAGTRTAVGALALGLVALALRRRFPRGRIWIWFLLIGLSGNALPFSLIGWGERNMDSAPAAILMASVPIFTLLLAHYLAEDDRMSRAKLAGIVLGFAGVFVLIGPRAVLGADTGLFAALAIIGAAFSYSCTNVMAQRIRHLPPEVAGACVLACSALWALSASLVTERPWMSAPSWASLGALGMLALVSTSLGNIIFFRLIARTTPSIVSLNNYLIPAMGVIFGSLFLGEAIGPRELAAMALILAGIAVTTGSPFRRRPGPEAIPGPAPVPNDDVSAARTAPPRRRAAAGPD